MRLVLRSDMPNGAKRGDIIEVADGYARNYLLPKGLAIVATPGVESQATAMRRSRDLRDGLLGCSLRRGCGTAGQREEKYD